MSVCEHGSQTGKCYICHGQKVEREFYGLLEVCQILIEATKFAAYHEENRKHDQAAVARAKRWRKAIDKATTILEE